MATRSIISIKTPTGGKSIYCHWDSYPSNNGALLKKHWNTKKKVEALIALGNLSILGETIGEKVPFDGFDGQVNKQCLAYGRDRNETDCKATSFKKMPTDTESWNYLFEDGKWFVSRNSENNFVRLTAKIIKADEIV